MSKWHQTKRYRYWKKRVLFRNKYKCDITGEKGGLATHHLWSAFFYSKKRYLIKQGVPIKIELHKLFHLYWMGGYKNICTPKDYYKFKKSYLNGTIFDGLNKK